MTDPIKADASAARAEPTYWTVERMKVFIDALRRTRNVAAAARAAGVNRRSAYRLRARLAGHPFDQAWEAALIPRRHLQQIVSEHGRDIAG